MRILSARNLKKYYGAEDNLTKALDGVDLDVEQGEFVAIIGASGSGKSTLLNMIGGLDVPTSGQVCIGGKEIGKMKPDELTVFRRKNIGFIFQIQPPGQNSYRDHLPPPEHRLHFPEL